MGIERTELAEYIKGKDLCRIGGEEMAFENNDPSTKHKPSKPSCTIRDGSQIRLKRLSRSFT